MTEYRKNENMREITIGWINERMIEWTKEWKFETKINEKI